MVNIHALTHYIGGRVLYEDVSFQIKRDNKIAFIGDNGAGKSTLFKIIVGELTPSYGRVDYDKGTTIGFFNQELLSYETDLSIREVAMGGFEEALGLQRRIEVLLKRLEVDCGTRLLEELGDLQERFTQIGGYDMEASTDNMLAKLGFGKDLLDRPFNEFSGGWRMRVMFAKLLLQKPSLLLLDEPTNHLDIVSIEWVENYLKNYNEAFMVISHDRRFLDAVTNRTMEITHQKIQSYAGNYSFFRKEKAQRAITEQNAYENQQKSIKRTETFINRFRAKSSKAKLVQSRIKALDRMEKIPPAVESKNKIHIRFKTQKNPGKKIVTLDGVSKSFGDLLLLESTSAQIGRGDKVALIGENGKGKSTLLKLIAREIPIDHGTITLGHNVIAGFYAQHQLESLKPKETPLTSLRRVMADEDEGTIRATLGAFLFRNDEVHKKISVLSGGEKARLSLAVVLASSPNFVLLDEPTNHLDVKTIEALTESLQNYPGTLIFVSHDRHFVQQLANKIWYIEDMKIKEYPGTYDEYIHWCRKKEGK